MTQKWEKRVSKKKGKGKESILQEGHEEKQNIPTVEKVDDQSRLKEEKSFSLKKKPTFNEMHFSSQNSNLQIDQGRKNKSKGKKDQKGKFKEKKDTEKRNKNGKETTPQNFVNENNEIPSMSLESFPTLSSTITFPTPVETISNGSNHKAKSVIFGKALIDTVKSDFEWKPIDNEKLDMELKNVLDIDRRDKQIEGIDLTKYNYIPKKKSSIPLNCSSVSREFSCKKGKKPWGFIREDKDFVRRHERLTNIQDYDKEKGTTTKKRDQSSIVKKMNPTDNQPPSPIKMRIKDKKNGTLSVQSVEKIDETRSKENEKKEFKPVISKKKFKTLPRLKKRILLERLELYRQYLGQNLSPDSGFEIVSSETEDIKREFPESKHSASIPPPLDHSQKEIEDLDDQKFRYILVLNNFAPLDCLEDEEEQVELQANAMLLCTEHINQSGTLISAVQIEYPDKDSMAEDSTENEDKEGNILVEFVNKVACLHAYHHLQGQIIQGEELNVMVRCIPRVYKSLDLGKEKIANIDETFSSSYGNEINAHNLADDTIHSANEMESLHENKEKTIDMIYQPMDGSVLVLHKFVETKEEVYALMEDEDEYLEYMENVHHLCGIYGTVLSVRLIQESCQSTEGGIDHSFREKHYQEEIGDVWVEYAAPLQAAKAKLHLNRKVVAGNLLTVSVLQASITEKKFNTTEMGVNSHEDKILVFQQFADIDDLVDNDEYEELLENVRSLCSVFGVIKSIVFPRDNCLDYGANRANKTTGFNWETLISVGDIAVEFGNYSQAKLAYASLKDIVVQGATLKLVSLKVYKENLTSLDRKSETDILIPEQHLKIDNLLNKGDIKIYETSPKPEALTRLEKFINKLKIKANPRIPPKYRIASVAPNVRGQTRLLEEYLPNLNKQAPLYIMTDQMIIWMKFILGNLMSLQEKARKSNLEERERKTAILSTTRKIRHGKKAEEEDDDKQPITKKRLVFGLNETKRYLKNKKVKILVLGQDMEINLKAIKETVEELFRLGTEVNVNGGTFDSSCIPIVTGLSSRQIGKALGKKIKVSVVGLINFDGANQEIKAFLKAFSKLKNDVLISV